MMTALRPRTMTAGLLLLAALAGCASDKDSKDKKKNTTDATALLTAYANNVVLADHTAFRTAAETLQAAVTTLGDAITEPNVTAARNAWLDTRVAWERSEAWLFGPVASQGIDPGVDTWPLNLTTITAAMLDTDPYSLDDDETKGFHTIEYVLWNITNTGNKTDTAANVAGALNATIVTNLGTVVQDLVDKAQTLEDAWSPSGGNYAHQFSAAGNGSAAYVSQSAAVQELVNGMVGIAQEVGEGKIAEPVDNGDADQVESQFSYNSINDFHNNILGIKLAYLGSYTATTTAAANSLSAFVATRNPTLDASIMAKIDAALAAIDGGDEAIAAVLELRDVLESSLLTLMQGIDFTH